MDPPRKDTKIGIVDHPQLSFAHRKFDQHRTLCFLDFGPIMPQSATRPPAHLNVSRDIPHPGALLHEDVFDTRSPSMAHQTERRTQDGQRLFNTASDGVCDLDGFANKENCTVDVMDSYGTMDVMDSYGRLLVTDSYGQYSTKRSNQQELFDPALETLRHYPESSTITIDNVKSKIHGTPHDSIAAWCFSIMSIIAFAMMILLGGPTSIDRWSASVTIVRLVFILGTQPLWNHGGSIQTARDLEGTTKERAIGSFLIESQSSIHQSSSRRALSSSISR